MKKDVKISIGLAVAAVTIFILLICGIVQIVDWCIKPVPTPIQTEIVVKDGREYQVLSFGSIMCGKLPCYLITFVYPDELAGIASGKIKTELRRGTIIVPKSRLQLDRDHLGRNRIIWDPAITIEGKQYRSARWYPGHILPADEIPQIRQEKPLTRIKR